MKRIRSRPRKKSETNETRARSYIVSSSHLASPGSENVGEFEYALILAYQAFSRWAVRCMTAAGAAELAILDVLVLHHIHHRNRPKRLSDLATALGVDDHHVINYSLKKLVRLRLIVRKKPGKEVFYSISNEGIAICERYREIRDACLAPISASFFNDKNALSELGQTLRLLSGAYDQAARSAASF